jgi:heat shock protein HslJ
MECPSPKGVMAQEGAYVEALSSAAAYRRTGERLEVEDAAGETTLVFVQSGIAEAHPDALLGTAWQLVSLNGANPLSNAAITLTFQDAHRISGHAGCRDYLVAYRAEDGELDLFYTGMLGPVCADEALQEQEGAFTTMLGWTDHFQLNDGLLELLTSRGERLLFEPLPEGAGASLEGATWSLLAFVEPSPAEGLPARPPLTVDVDEGTEITITFEGDALRGSAGCNSYQAGTHLDGSALSVEGVAVKGMACPSPEGVMEQEGRYLGVLKDVTDAQLFGQRLWLETDDGRGLVFRVQE